MKSLVIYIRSFCLISSIYIRCLIKNLFNNLNEMWHLIIYLTLGTPFWTCLQLFRMIVGWIVDSWIIECWLNVKVDFICIVKKIYCCDRSVFSVLCVYSVYQSKQMMFMGFILLFMFYLILKFFKILILTVNRFTHLELPWTIK